MSLLADSTPPKCLSESSKFQHRIKRSKLNLSKDYAETYGKSEYSGNVKKPRFSYGALKDRDSKEKLGAHVADFKEFLNQIKVQYSKPNWFEVVDEGKAAVGIEAEEKDDQEKVRVAEEKDDQEKVRVLSPTEWSTLPLHLKEKCSSRKSSEKENVDLVDLCDQQSEKFLVSKLAEAEYRKQHQEKSYTELINLEAGKHEQPQHNDVMETMKLFQVKYHQLKKFASEEIRRGKISKPAHTEAGELIKKMGMSVFVEKPFGHIPGIEIGDAFRFRAELAIVGLHGQYVFGINYVNVHGKICATSVVESGQYMNTAKPDVLIYSGQGGNPKLICNASHQKLVRGNLALVNSMEMGFPVRVIFKRRDTMACRTLGASKVYVYDGLYSVNDCRQGRGEHGYLVYKFELRRLPGQQRLREINVLLSKPIKNVDVCVLNDVSQGKEKFSVRVVNGVDEERPLLFTYVTKVVYPHWFKCVEPIGCNCTNGCSNLKQCTSLTNDDNILLNEDGVKPKVHECGPSCINKVTQHSPRHHLEIFRTNLRGWGLRSRNYISKGSFVCEYIGELVRVKDVQHKIGNDEYLFHKWKVHYEGGQGQENGFALDSRTYGNIGRFVNHSCSPNLITKEVFLDHDDKRLPHIMFYASKNIGSKQELTYDYRLTKDS